MNNPQVAKEIAQLKDEDDQVRFSAVYMLWQIGDASAVPALIETLKDENSSIRHCAAKALEEIRDASAIPALIEALKDQDKYVRLSAVQALRKIGDAASAVPALSEALKDQDAQVHHDAAAALGEIASASAVAALIEALKDQDSSVRREAAEALGKAGDSVTLPRKILADLRFSAQQRMEVLDSLRRLRYQDFSITLRYTFPDTPALCQTILKENDAHAHKGAQTVLNWLNGDRELLLASQPDHTTQAQELLRAGQGDTSDPQPETLLRASDES